MSQVSIQLDQYLRAANYLTAAQIFLQDNFLLERELSVNDVKSRLLGHWGSCPGVNFAYAHLSLLAKKRQQEMMFVLGPGHAFPALQANLYLEGTLEKFYPEATQSLNGLGYICKNFSWPYGFPSHSSPGTPGVILEGGELGYSLSTAYGAALDNPDLMVACMIGDGEAETGPIAASWHLNKLFNPKTGGKVLPILHLNGYKISAPTVFGRMSDAELTALFTGYGYVPKIVDATDGHAAMQEALEWAHDRFEGLRAGKVATPHSPMIVLRSPKGWTGVKELDGRKVEGNHLSHQVVLTEAKTNPEQLNLLRSWLGSYKIDELFDAKKGFGGVAEAVMPKPELRLGMNPKAMGGKGVYEPLKLPGAEAFAEEPASPGEVGSSSMRRAGLFLSEVFKLNAKQRNFRMMSPDETYSNKLDEIFKNTSRAWQWPIEEWDRDLDPDGRVMEMLSEHNLQGLAQGYILTGRHAVFASYEAFVPIVTSMMDQYAKFLNQSRQVPWRGTISSLNYILTSSGWRQEHNGFSHQNPGFIDDVLRRQGDFADVYFPPDGNSTLAVLEHAMATTRQINVIVAGKTQEPRWLTLKQARSALKSGAEVWDFASDDNPDVVLTAAGDYTTKEALAAIDLVKRDWPSVKLRFVNIMSLTNCGIGAVGTCLSQPGFLNLFTPDKPIICNFHGYPETLKAIFFDYMTGSPQRLSIHGYIESGSTTTPFDMHVRNRTSRYHLASEVMERLAAAEVVPYEEAQHTIASYHQRIEANTAHIKQHGVDLPEIEGWQWQPTL